MKINAPVLAGFVGSLILTAAAQASIIGVSVVNVSASFAANPMYNPATMSTWQISLQFSAGSSAESITGTTAWNVNTTAGHTFFNADPVGQDPVGLINDANGGNVPQPGVAGLTGAFPVYFNWAFDTFLTLDTPTSGGTSQEPVFVGLNAPNEPLSLGNTHIGPGGLFSTPPFPTAGADLLMPVAQITIITAAGQLNPLLATGSFIAVQGAASQTVQFQIAIPGPGALALLGAAGLVGTRRRRA